MSPTERFRASVALRLSIVDAMVRSFKYLVVGGVIVGAGWAYRPSIEDLAGQTTVVNANIAVGISFGLGGWGVVERRRRLNQKKQVDKLENVAGRYSTAVKVLQDRLRQHGHDAELPEELREDR